MTISVEVLISILVFLAVFMIIEGIYLIAFGSLIDKENKVKKRLDTIDNTKDREEVLERLRKELTQNQRRSGIPIYSALAARSHKGGVLFSPEQLLFLMVVLSVGAYFALAFGTSASFPLRIMVAIGIGFGSVWMWVDGKAKKRVQLIEEQLPETVELLVRSLNVGHPFASAVQIAAKEIPAPLGTEFTIVADEAAYGRDIAESLREMADRIDMQDLRFLAVAVSIQQQSGGNLAVVLAGLARVIRSRFKLFRRVKAITSEAKWSGTFLSMFPLIALLLINVLKPDYFDEVKESDAFVIFAFVVFGFLAANVVIMKRLVNIRV